MSETGKLRWRCRRGMKELDLLLLGYLDGDYGSAASGERYAFAELLELQDPELWSLISGRVQTADPAVADVIEKINAVRN